MTPAAVISTQGKTGAFPAAIGPDSAIPDMGLYHHQPSLMSLSSSAGTKQAINTYSID